MIIYDFLLRKKQINFRLLEKFKNLKEIEKNFRLAQEIDNTNKLGQTALQVLLEKGKYSYRNGKVDYFIDILINRNAEFVNNKDYSGQTTLKYAIKAKRFDIVKDILSSENYIKNKYDETLLSSLVKTNELALVKNFVNIYDDVNIEGSWGKTPIYEAIENSNMDIIELLIDMGSKIIANNPQSKHDYSPLKHALDKNNEEIIALLLKNSDNKCNKEISNFIYEDYPILIYSVKNLNHNLISMLCSIKINLDIASKDGKTALFYAIENDDINICHLLIENGANINLENGKNQTPLNYAILKNNYKIAQILLENGGELNSNYSLCKKLLENILVGNSSFISFITSSGIVDEKMINTLREKLEMKKQRRKEWSEERKKKHEREQERLKKQEEKKRKEEEKLLNRWKKWRKDKKQEKEKMKQMKMEQMKMEQMKMEQMKMEQKLRNQKFQKYREQQIDLEIEHESYGNDTRNYNSNEKVIHKLEKKIKKYDNNGKNKIRIYDDGFEIIFFRGKRLIYSDCNCKEESLEMVYELLKGNYLVEYIDGGTYELSIDGIPITEYSYNKRNDKGVIENGFNKGIKNIKIYFEY